MDTAFIRVDHRKHAVRDPEMETMIFLSLRERERIPRNGGSQNLMCKRLTCESVKTAHSPEASILRFWPKMAQGTGFLVCNPIVKR